MSEEKPPELPSAPQQPGEKTSGRKGCLVAIGLSCLSPLLFVASIFLASGENDYASVLGAMSFLLPMFGVLIWLGSKRLYEWPREDATTAPEDEPEDAEQ